MEKRRAITLIEALVVLAAAFLVLSLLVPSLSSSKRHQRRRACASNLKELAVACYMYAQNAPCLFPMMAPERKQNDGAMTLFNKRNRTTKPGTDALPSPTVDMWALLRSHNAEAEMFVCPGTKDVPDPATDVMSYYDFASAKNLSYAYQYQYDPDRKPLSMSSAPNFPLMADGNPYIKGKKSKKDILKDRLSKYSGNSRNHGKSRPGQNVLFVNSCISFEVGPDIGLSGRVAKAVRMKSRGRDNIYTTHNVTNSKARIDPGDDKPTKKKCNLGSRSDACLVP